MKAKRKFWVLLLLASMILLTVAALAEGIMPLVSDDTPCNHVVACSNPNKCLECGQQCEGIEPTVHQRQSDTYVHDETSHWYLCHCNQQTNVEEHRVNCGETTCAQCKAPYSGPNIVHTPDAEMGHDDEMHWQNCTVCDQAFDKASHSRNCNSSICPTCQAEYKGDSNIKHTAIIYDYNADGHWEWCSACDTRLSDAVTAHTSNGYRSDETNHYLDCAVCHFTYETEAHQPNADGSECLICNKNLGTTEPDPDDPDDPTTDPDDPDDPTVDPDDPDDPTTDPDDPDDPTTDPDDPDDPTVDPDDPDDPTADPDDPDDPTTDPDDPDDPTTDPDDPDDPTTDPEDPDDPTTDPGAEETDDPKVSPSPVVTETPDVSPAPVVTETPEISPAPVVTDAPEVSATPDATDTPEASATPDMTEAPEVSAAPDVTDEPTPSPEATEIPEPEASATPDVTDIPEASAMPDMTEPPEESAAPDVTGEPTPSPEATEIPEPEASATPDSSELPDATDTPTATRQPNKTAARQPEANGESFLSRFQSNSDVAADGELLSGNVTETITLAMDTVTEEDSYHGSMLTVFATGSRHDAVTICLSSQYEPERVLQFHVWQESIKEISALRQSAEFTSFVELAEALVQALLPELSTDEADAIIVSILQSGFDGALDAIGDYHFDEDVDGDIVGYLQQNGYEFFLVLQDDHISLLVREMN